MFAQTINLHITRVFADQILGALTNRPAAALLDAPLNAPHQPDWNQSAAS